jgi:hypothetical protein
MGRSTDVLWIMSGALFSREQWDPSKYIGVSQKVNVCGAREIRMVLDHMRTERGMRAVCWSGFPLLGYK